MINLPLAYRAHARGYALLSIEQTMRVRGARQQVAMKIGAMVLLLVVGAAIMLTLGNGGG